MRVAEINRGFECIGVREFERRIECAVDFKLWAPFTNGKGRYVTITRKAAKQIACTMAETCSDIRVDTYNTSTLYIG